MIVVAQMIDVCFYKCKIKYPEPAHSEFYISIQSQNLKVVVICLPSYTFLYYTLKPWNPQLPHEMPSYAIWYDYC